ncbi:MAG TPA: hypothetical protein VGF69_16750 [Thermoanaerobaculia bacterium]|jgi:hypothetical protein
MSQSNGEKARASIAKKRRTAQRLKDRARRAELGIKGPSGSEQKTADQSADASK